MRSERKEGAKGHFADEVENKEKRALGERARRLGASARREGSLSWIGTIGIVGWCVTLPMLAGIALGRWIDARTRSVYSFTIMLLVGGLGIGCVAAWTWVRRRLELGGPRKPGEEKPKDGKKPDGGPE